MLFIVEQTFQLQTISDNFHLKLYLGTVEMTVPSLAIYQQEIPRNGDTTLSDKGENSWTCLCTMIVCILLKIACE